MKREITLERSPCPTPRQTTITWGSFAKRSVILNRPRNCTISQRSQGTQEPKPAWPTSLKWAGVLRPMPPGNLLLFPSSPARPCRRPYNLGRIYQNGLPDPIQPIQPNPQLAEQYLRQAGAQGVVSAFHQLGVLYYQLGLSLTADSIPKETFEEWDTNDDNIISPQENRHLRDAHDHFLLAAQQGYGPALHAMGVIYQQGHGVPADPAQAVRWLEQAIAHPQPDS